jgi:hypothetical protein
VKEAGSYLVPPSGIHNNSTYSNQPSSNQPSSKKEYSGESNKSMNFYLSDNDISEKEEINFSKNLKIGNIKIHD